MSKREDEAYQIFLQEMKQQFPDSAGALDAIAGTSFGREVYRSGLREDEFNRRLNTLTDEKRQFELDRIQKQNELEAKNAELRDWFEREKPKNSMLEAERARLESELRGMKAEFVRNGLDVPENINQAISDASSRKSSVDADAVNELRARYDALDKGLPHMFAASIEIGRRLSEEKFQVNPADIIAHAARNNVDPLSAYEFVTKPQREAREAQRLEERLKAAREEGERAALSKIQGLDRIRPSAPSVIDALRATGDNAPIVDRGARVDAAMRDFLELQSAKA